MTTNRLKLHAAIVDQMAHTRGVDLEQAALRGDISTDVILDLVLRCAGCTQTQTCQNWLVDQVGTASDTPHYCRNAHAFKALAVASARDT
ncbi:DUF6455 family protein [Tateyamaria sp.]|uniref:DUF6455 family protein n=1 Tax=Tateyamaria sp. TaxID=1929288 RepID=UPI0032A0BDDC